jgi:O-antigen/teichoic acid export membrane protein
VSVPPPESTRPAPPLSGRIAKVAAASAGAQVIGEVVSLVQTVVLARTLGPTVVGVFTAGTVLTMFLANLAEGGMRAGLVHRESRLADAAETVFWGTLVSGGLMSLGALAAAPVVGLVFDSPEAGLVAAATSGMLLLHCLTNVPEAMLQRQFSVLRRIIVGPAVSISFAIVSVTTAALGFGVWSLVAGSYASYVVWVIGVWAICDWRPRRGRASLALWRELARFGYPLVAGIVGERVQQLVEAVVVGRGLSTTALGHYRYGVRISRIPVSAIVEIASNALFPAFSRIAGDPERLRSNYLRALRWVTFFAAAVSGLTMAIGMPAVVVLLGEPWRGAGVAVVAMAGLGLGMAMSSVSHEALKGCGRTSLINYMTATEVVLGIGLLVLVIPFGLVGVGLAISLTALAVGVQYLVLVRPVVGITLGDLRRALLPPIVAAALATGVTVALENGLLHSDTHAVLAGLGLLLLDALAFTAVYVGALTILAPATVAGALRAVRGAAGKLRRR